MTNDDNDFKKMQKLMEDSNFAMNGEEGDQLLDKLLKRADIAYVKESHMKYDDNSYKNYDGSDAEIYRIAYNEGYNAGYKQCMCSKAYYRNNKKDGTDFNYGGF